MTTIKVIELIGESQKSWTEAVENAIAEACETIDGISGVEILSLKGTVRDGKIVEYKANVQLAFPVRDKREQNL
ncbi:hypothetical protein BBF96_02220 [Anoxybacter fermentans]|uniref:Dodecin domain-containing protein n=1 Tax=Anoxybacter fermentans TaxID=1323375 RepID=A0A3Q9HP32_9FIRM|nr:dodecin family protein [Anoxybacter fermentans]AZR72311.1 hypothetical protein BBF96_02220 [Anoxybacter fermentans]